MLNERKYEHQSTETPQSSANENCGREAEGEGRKECSVSPPPPPSSNECPPPLVPCQYEYLDHTADVQLHAWGQSLGEALEQLTIALYGYMTIEIDRVEPIYTMDFSASGHDLSALVYNLLDNCLYSFCAEPFFIGRVAKFLNLKKPSGNTGEELSEKNRLLFNFRVQSMANFIVQIRIWGESFDPQKHPQGTEIKAITYSNMQIIRKEEEEDEGGKVPIGRTDIFVIVDI